jgi:multiple sugar transport system substrate-binding protein
MRTGSTPDNRSASRAWATSRRGPKPRRAAAVLALSLTVAPALAGCGSSKPSAGSGGNVTLNLLGADYGSGPSDTSTKYWQNLAAQFHASHPHVTVKVTTINWTDYDTKVKTQIQNHDYPDILQGEYFPQYALDHLLEPVKNVLSNPDSGIGAFKPQFTTGGTQYGVSFDTSARELFYNKKAFKAAGLSRPPRTWGELQTDAAALKRKGYTGYALPLGPEDAQSEAYLWMLGNGGGWQDAAGKYTINSSQNVETFNFLKGLVAAGNTQPTNPATYPRTAGAATDFAAGKVGMELNGPFLTATIASAGKLKPGGYAAAPVPGKTGPIAQTLGVADAIQVFKTGDAAKRAAITSFLDFALKDTNQLAWAKEYSLLPGTQSAADELADDPVLGPFVKALPKTALFPTSANWTATVLPAVDHLIGTAVTGNPATVLGRLQSTATSGD